MNPNSTIGEVYDGTPFNELNLHMVIFGKLVVLIYYLFIGSAKCFNSGFDIRYL
jgi:hypothetical protein